MSKEENDKFIDINENTLSWYQNIDIWCRTIIDKYKETHTEDFDYIQGLRYKFFYINNDNIRIVCEKYIKNLTPKYSNDIHLLIPIDYVCSPFVECMDKIKVEIKNI